MTGQPIEHRLALPDTLALDPLTQHDLLVVVVKLLDEHKLLCGLNGKHRPAGEAAGDLYDVLLGVAAVDAQGVQLQQLAGVVLVQSARLRFLRLAAFVLLARLTLALHRLALLALSAGDLSLDLSGLDAPVPEHQRGNASRWKILLLDRLRYVG